MTIDEFINQYGNIKIEKFDEGIELTHTTSAGYWGAFDIQNEYGYADVEDALGEFAGYVEGKKDDAYWSS